MTIGMLLFPCHNLKDPSKMTKEHNIILYGYTYSPFVQRIQYYLTLRGIPFKLCLQPPILPRPDVELLGLKHRRIPILAIGRDIYFDTRLMLQKLEELFPPGFTLGQTHMDGDNKNNSKKHDNKALEELLEEWTVTRVFPQASFLIPTILTQDPKFIKDREEYSGRSWQTEDIERLRPEAVVFIRGCLEFLEKTLLGDGREWILGTEHLGLVDLKSMFLSSISLSLYLFIYESTQFILLRLFLREYGQTYCTFDSVALMHPGP